MKKEQIIEFLKTKKIIIIIFIFWILLSGSLYLSYKNEWQSAMVQPLNVIEVGEFGDNDETILLEDQNISQEIVVNSDKMTGFSLYINTDNENFDGVLETELIDKKSNNKIQEWSYNFNEIKYDGFFYYTLDKPLVIDKEKKITINLKMENRSKSIPRLVLVENEDLGMTKLEIDGETNGKIIPYKITNGNHAGLRYFIFALYIGMTTLLFVMSIMIINKKRVECIFVSMILILGFVYMFVIPPFAVPDEYAHFLTAYAKSSQLLGMEALDDQGKVVVMPGRMWENNLNKSGASRDTYLQFMKGTLGKGEEFESVGETISTRTPLIQSGLGYFPQITGVTLARLFKLNFERILIVGRVFALLWYCLNMFWAIRLIPFGKMTLFVVGMLPMTLQQVVSYNYDSVLFGSCFLSIAYLLYLKYEKKKILWYDLTILACIAIIIALVKFVYLPIIVGLGLLIREEKYGGKKKKRVSIFVLLLGSFGFSVVARMSALSDMAKVPTETAEGSWVKMSLEYCMQHPLRMIEIFYRTIERQTSEYLSQMLATPLGHLDTPLPQIIVTALVVIILFSLLRKKDEKQFDVSDVGKCSLIIVIIVIGMIMVALLLGWTSIDATQIEGIQGRYFLPLLPLLVVLSQNRLAELKKDINHYLIVSMGVVQCISVYFLTLVAIGR